MLPNFQKHLKKLDDLKLDPNLYMITGSGPMAVRGIRDCDDMDIVVDDALGKQLKQLYPESVHTYPSHTAVVVEGLDFMFNFTSPNRPFTTQQQLDEAEMIDGRKYQTLERVKFFKKKMGRDKDLADLELIENYENKLQ